MLSRARAMLRLSELGGSWSNWVAPKSFKSPLLLVVPHTTLSMQSCNQLVTYKHAHQRGLQSLPETGLMLLLLHLPCKLPQEGCTILQYTCSKEHC